MGGSLGDYEVLETIGHGSFGKVCKIRRKEDGKVGGSGSNEEQPMMTIRRRRRWRIKAHHPGCCCHPSFYYLQNHHQHYVNVTIMLIVTHVIDSLLAVSIRSWYGRRSITPI